MLKLYPAIVSAYAFLTDNEWLANGPLSLIIPLLRDAARKKKKQVKERLI